MSSAVERKTLIVLSRGPIFDLNNINSAKYEVLSEKFDGMVCHELESRILRNKKLGGFLLEGVQIPRIFNKLKFSSHFFYMFVLGYRLIFRRDRFSRIDYVVTTNPYLINFLALIIRRLKGSRFIIELNGNYASRYNWDISTFTGRLKRRVGLSLAKYFIESADAVKTLYDSQLRDVYDGDKDINVHVFHEFVPVSRVHEVNQDENFILFLGFPWFLKGLDILIEAYKLCEFDDSGPRLKLVGYFPAKDLQEINKLIGECKGVDVEAPVSYECAQELISKCSFLVLPSRTEGMGRVLLEAMAHGKPVIGSNVDGIPSVIKHGLNGYLFPVGDAESLRHFIMKLASDVDHRRSVGSLAKSYVNENLNEEIYLSRYVSLVTSAERS